MRGPAKLEKGGLALITWADYAKENIGREVTLREFLPPGKRFGYRGFFATGAEPTGTWVVEAKDLHMVGLINGEVIETIVADCSFAKPHHLMPLRGKDPEQHKVKGRVFMEKMK